LRAARAHRAAFFFYAPQQPIEPVVLPDLSPFGVVRRVVGFGVPPVEENGKLQPVEPTALPVVPTAPGVPPVAFIGVPPVGFVGVEPVALVGVDPVVDPAWPPVLAAWTTPMPTASNSAAAGTARIRIFRICEPFCAAPSGNRAARRIVPANVINLRRNEDSTP
jgi:hypothetical protein